MCLCLTRWRVTYSPNEWCTHMILRLAARTKRHSHLPIFPRLGGRRYKEKIEWQTITLSSYYWVMVQPTAIACILARLLEHFVFLQSNNPNSKCGAEIQNWPRWIDAESLNRRIAFMNEMNDGSGLIFYTSNWWSIYQSIYLPFYFFICLTIQSGSCSHAWFSIYPTGDLFINLFIYLSMYSSVLLSN